jgi:hypothetical protein
MEDKGGVAMTTPGKAPLDNRSETSEDGRAERFAEIERRSGDKVGAKEMALTKKPRDEDDSKRAEKFVEIERRSED